MKNRELRESGVHKVIPWSEKGEEGVKEQGLRREQVEVGCEVMWERQATVRS